MSWTIGADSPVTTTQAEDGSYRTLVTSNGGSRTYRCTGTDAMGETAWCVSGYEYRQITITEQPQGGMLPDDGTPHRMFISVADGEAPYTYSLINPTGDNQIAEGSGDKFFFDVSEPEWYQIYVEDAKGEYAYSEMAIVTQRGELCITDYTDYVYYEHVKEPALLKVQVEGGMEPYYYVWERTDCLYDPDRPNLFETTEPELSVTPCDGDVYICRVIDDRGDQATSGEMHTYYTGAQPVIIQQPENVNLKYVKGDHYAFMLSCTAISGRSLGGEGLVYTWIKGNLHGQNTQTLEPQESRIKIRGTLAETQGLYRCRVYDPISGATARSRIVTAKIKLVLEKAEQVGTAKRIRLTLSGGKPSYTIRIYEQHLRRSNRYPKGRYVTVRISRYVRKNISQPLTFPIRSRFNRDRFRGMTYTDPVQYQIVVQDKMGNTVKTKIVCKWK